jgi:hypothetical protein
MSLLHTFNNIITQYDSLMGYFTVRDAIIMEHLNKGFRRIISSQKIAKKLVRFGNLNSNLRLKFWIQQCPFFSL